MYNYDFKTLLVHYIWLYWTSQDKCTSVISSAAEEVGSERWNKAVVGVQECLAPSRTG